MIISTCSRVPVSGRRNSHDILYGLGVMDTTFQILPHVRNNYLTKRERRFYFRLSIWLAYRCVLSTGGTKNSWNVSKIVICNLISLLAREKIAEYSTRQSSTRISVRWPLVLIVHGGRVDIPFYREMMCSWWGCVIMPRWLSNVKICCKLLLKWDVLSRTWWMWGNLSEWTLRDE